MHELVSKGTELTSDELADGPHTFEVQATDEAGNTDPSPASVDFTIDATAPETTIESGPGVSSPGELTNDRTPAWTFSSDDAAADFECQVDSGSWTACDQSFTAPSLNDGAHAFRVRAVDEAGLVANGRKALAVDLAGPLAEAKRAEALRMAVGGGTLTADADEVRAVALDAEPGGLVLEVVLAGRAALSLPARISARHD